MDKIQKIKQLVSELNIARNNYYNNSNKNGISDYEYDMMFDELNELENETNFIMSNSPTQEVGYKVLDKLPKSLHKYPMLSLAKTKKPTDLLSFVNNKDALIMFKMDGMTCSATYDDDGNLSICESRGNGVEGSLITNNAMTFLGLPHKINHKGGLTVFGEAIIDYPTFYSINEKLPNDSKYKNPRNLCAGSVSLLDSKICAERGVRFIAWRLVSGYDNNSFSERLSYLNKLGFDIVPYITMPKDIQTLENRINEAKEEANELGLCIDGLVISLEDVALIESMGMTSHHMRGQLAFKYCEDKEFTTLRSVEWSVSKTQITPVAIFDTVELADTLVSRASLHNIDIMNQLNIKIGSQVEICKRNEIVPNIESCDGNGEEVVIPHTCPVCGGKTEIYESTDGTHTLICTNENCKGKLLGRLSHFVSKNAMNIDGLSEATLDFLIKHGWVNSFIDLYSLSQYRDKWVKYEGFGIKSVDKLLSNIEKSRNTNLTRFIYSLSCPLIGNTASKSISKNILSYADFIDKVKSHYDWTILDDFGQKMSDSLDQFFNEHLEEVNELSKLMTFEEKTTKITGTLKDLSNLTFVITGSVHAFHNRDEIKNAIEEHNGKVTGSVTSKTSFLVCNEISDSGKSKKARELGIKQITEEELISMMY